MKNGELVVNDFFSLGEKHYALSTIEKITTAPWFVVSNGTVIRRREYIVRFAGGKWTTHNIPSDPDLKAKSNFVELLSKRSGVPIEEKTRFDVREVN